MKSFTHLALSRSSVIVITVLLFWTVLSPNLSSDALTGDVNPGSSFDAPILSSVLYSDKDTVEINETTTIILNLTASGNVSLRIHNITLFFLENGVVKLDPIDISYDRLHSLNVNTTRFYNYNLTFSRSGVYEIDSSMIVFSDDEEDSDVLYTMHSNSLQVNVIDPDVDSESTLPWGTFYLLLFFVTLPSFVSVLLLQLNIYLKNKNSR